MTNKFVIVTAVAVLVLAGGYVWLSRPSPNTNSVSEMHNGSDTQAGMRADSIVVPPLSGLAQQGEAAFSENCAACHGVNLVGTNQGPPLIHSLYRPNHHADASIVFAAMNGVQAHHWQFGNMPPVEGITSEELTVIIAYIREMQRANGVQ